MPAPATWLLLQPFLRDFNVVYWWLSRFFFLLISFSLTNRHSGTALHLVFESCAFCKICTGNTYGFANFPQSFHGRSQTLLLERYGVCRRNVLARARAHELRLIPSWNSQTRLQFLNSFSVFIVNWFLFIWSTRQQWRPVTGLCRVLYHALFKHSWGSDPQNSPQNPVKWRIFAIVSPFSYVSLLGVVKKTTESIGLKAAIFHVVDVLTDTLNIMPSELRHSFAS